MNVRNDLKSLYVCIKELRKLIEEGKKLYGWCALSNKCLEDFKIQIKGQMSELDSLTTKLQLPKTSIEDHGTKVEKIHDVIKKIGN